MVRKTKDHTKDKIKTLSKLTGQSLLTYKKVLAEANSEFHTAKEILLLKTTEKENQSQ